LRCVVVFKVEGRIPLFGGLMSQSQTSFMNLPVGSYAGFEAELLLRPSIGPTSLGGFCTVAVSSEPDSSERILLSVNTAVLISDKARCMLRTHACTKLTAAMLVA